MAAGHETIRTGLVDKLTAELPAWLALEQDGAWPPDVRSIAAAGILPSGDSDWPCVVVHSTSLGRRTLSGAMPITNYLSRYTVQITAGVRGRKERDTGSVTVGAARILQAIRNCLMSDPVIAVDGRADLSADNLIEELGEVVTDEKGRLIALAHMRFPVSLAESLPDPSAVAIDALDVELRQATDAGQSLDEALAYDDNQSTYDEAADDYIGGRIYPPAP